MAERTHDTQEETQHGNTSKELSAMEEQRNVIAQTVNRLTTVETRMTVVETKLGYYDAALAKQEMFNDRVSTAIAQLPVQLEATKDLIKAVEQRTQEHNTQIVNLTKENVDTGKILESLKGRVNVLWGIGGALATILFGYFVTHYIHF